MRTPIIVNVTTTARMIISMSCQVVSSWPVAVVCNTIIIVNYRIAGNFGKVLIWGFGEFGKDHHIKKLANFD